jgi:flagellin-like hook-associated protein FlgL
MSFMTRYRLRRALRGLTYQRHSLSDDDLWKALVEETIRRACPDSVAHQRVKALNTPLPRADATSAPQSAASDSATKPVERSDANLVRDDKWLGDYAACINAALYTLKLPGGLSQPGVSSEPDPDFEREVLGIVDRKLLETPLVRVAKWTVPAILAVILGGTVWGGFQVTGLYNKAREHIQALGKEGHEKINEVVGDDKRQTGILGELNRAKVAALEKITTPVGTDERPGPILLEVRSQKNQVLGELTKKQTEATKQVDGALNAATTAVKEREQRALSTLETQTKEIPARLDRLDGRLSALDVRLAALGTQIKSFDVTAAKVTEAHKILTEHQHRVSGWATMELIARSDRWLVGLAGLAGVVGGILMILISKVLKLL